MWRVPNRGVPAKFLEAEASGLLQGLFNVLASAGISVGGQANAEKYIGVLREEFGEQLNNVRTCRAAIWKDVLIAASPGTRPDAPEEPRKPPQPVVRFVSMHGQRLVFDCNFSAKRRWWNEDGRVVVIIPIDIANIGDVNMLADNFVASLTLAGGSIVLEADRRVPLDGIDEPPVIIRAGETSEKTLRFLEPTKPSGLSSLNRFPLGRFQVLI